MERRSFIATGLGGLALTSIPGLFGGMSATALADVDSFASLAKISADTDRVMVLVQLQGGNDGLNTIIPIEDPLYYAARPTLSIPKNSVLPLSAGSGWHPALSPFKRLYDAGEMALVHGVTYNNPDRSHFRGTDIWLTATDANVFENTGWVGRYLETLLPSNYPDTMPPYPLAVQIGTTLSLGFQSEEGGLGITFRDPDEFYRLVGGGGTSGTDDTPPNTPAGFELKFIRTVQEAAEVYSRVVKTAGDKGKNAVDYPTSDLAQRLRVVAQMISGGLQTKFYLVSIGGFDTHVQQGGPTGAHAQLLTELSQAIGAFMDDMKAQGHADRVAGMTFSEFGRRVRENGSRGTDHGTAAPLFVFGKNVLGGKTLGSMPSLNPQDLDNRGDVKMQFDYRQIYASALGQWFGKPASEIQQVLLGKQFDALPLFAQPSSVAGNLAPNGFSAVVSPNPVVSEAVVRFTLPSDESVRLRFFDQLGNCVGASSLGTLSAGEHSVPFSAMSLPSGSLYVLFETRTWRDLIAFTVVK